MKLTTRLLALACVLALAAGPAAASTPQRRDSARHGGEFLAARQMPNGAFFSEAQTPDDTAEVIVALVAAGGQDAAVQAALNHVRTHGPQRATRASFTGRIVSGLVAAGRDPRSFGGFDYVARLESYYDPVSGAYDSNLYANVLAMLGVVAAGRPVPGRAIAYLTAHQCPDGGFAWAEGCTQTPDVDTTAAAVTALASSGNAGHPAVGRARQWLVSAQHPEGGFGIDAQTPANANATGLALTAIATLGEDAEQPPWRTAQGANPVAALRAMQDASGGFRYRTADTTPNPYATVQATTGMAGRAWPVHPAAVPTPAPGTPTQPPAPAPAPPGQPAPPASPGPDTPGPATAEPQPADRATPSPARARVLGVRASPVPVTAGPATTGTGGQADDPEDEHAVAGTAPSGPERIPGVIGPPSPTEDAGGTNRVAAAVLAVASLAAAGGLAARAVMRAR